MENVYDLIDDVIERPILRRIDDESVGYQRLTVKAMRLRLVRPDDSVSDECQLSDDDLTCICGSGVTDRKYVPAVSGFYCYNRETEKLIPIEIRIPVTGLAYSPNDTEDEWALAKMVLNAATTSYHQWQHFIDTHTVLIPLLVELMCNMATNHPVRALLEQPAPFDLGLEVGLVKLLLSGNTTMDRTFGWGATGSARGLVHISSQKYAAYARKLFVAVHDFVDSFIDVYYEHDGIVAHDHKLQNWAKASAQVPHLKDFPSEIQSKSQLSPLVTHLCVIRHHAMNSAAGWHMGAVPYSTPALWKEMPQEKLKEGEKFDLMDYAIPPVRMPDFLFIASYFHRSPRQNETLSEAYKSAPLSTEPELQDAIAVFHMRMSELDKSIENRERDEAQPFDILRPTKLPVNSWV